MSALSREFERMDLEQCRRSHRAKTPEELEVAAFDAFCRNMADYELGELHTAFYGDPGVREFWMAEARGWAKALGVEMAA